jgi:hypothetical protein
VQMQHVDVVWLIGRRDEEDGSLFGFVGFGVCTHPSSCAE